MENLLTYIIQVNILLSLIYLGYSLLLKGMTFYMLNRGYFIMGSIYAFMYPFLDLKSWFLNTTEVQIGLMPEFMSYIQTSAEQQTSFTLADLFLYVIAIVAFVFILKLIIQLISLFRIHLYSEASNWKTYIFRNVLFPVVPFSFFNSIYVHKEQHQEKELQDIFAHEHIHVKGYHTIDILLFEIIFVLCWYNPFVWLIRKAVRQNLEFLTDQQVLNNGVDKQTYQYSLLHVTRQGAAVGITNQFNFKTLKKRIVMMNKKRSSRLELSKYAFLIPMFLIVGMTFTVSKAEQNIEEVVKRVNDIPVDLSAPEGLLKDLNKRVIKANATSKDSIGYLLDDKLVSSAVINTLNPKDVESVVLNTNNEITKQYHKRSIIHIKTKAFEGTLGSPSEYERIIINGNHFEITGGTITTKFGETQTVQDTKNIDENNKSREYKDSITNKKTIPHISLNGSVSKFSTPDKALEISGLQANKQQKSITLKPGRGEVGDDASLADKNISIITAQKPLIVVDDKVVENNFNINTIDPNAIKSIQVYKGSKATDLYGDKAKMGVLIISTKPEVQFASKPIDYRGLLNSHSKKRELPVGMHGFEIPLYVVDGIEQPYEFDPNKIPANKVKSFNILRGTAARNQYGNKGKDGVVIITTKENADSGTEFKSVSSDELEKVSKSSASSSQNDGVQVINGFKKGSASTTQQGAQKEVVVMGYKK